MTSSESPSTTSSTAVDDSTPSTSSSSTPSASTAKSTGEPSTSQSTSPTAPSQSSTESTVSTISDISSGTTPISSSASSVPTSPSISTSFDISTAETQSTFVQDETSSSQQSSTHFLSSSEGTSTISSTGIDFTATALDNGSTSAAPPSVTTSASSTTDGDSTEGFSTTDQSTSSNPSSTEPFESTHLITETVPDTNTQLSTSSAGLTSERIPTTQVSAGQSTPFIEFSTDDYEETTASENMPTGSYSTSPQEPITLLELDTEGLYSPFMEDSTTTGALEATSSSTPFHSTELLDQRSSSDSSQGASTDRFSSRSSSSRTSIAKTESSTSSPSEAISIDGSNSTRRGMARTEGTMAPLDQLIMETESDPIRSASSTSSGDSEVLTEEVPTTLDALFEVTSEAEPSDGPMTTTEEDQSNQEDPTDLAIDPVDWRSTVLDHSATRAQTQFITTVSHKEQSTSTAVRDISTSVMQRRSIPSSTPPNQPTSVFTDQKYSSTTIGLQESQSTATADQPTSAMSMNDTRSPSDQIISAASDTVTTTVGQSPQAASIPTVSQPVSTRDGSIIYPVSPEQPARPIQPQPVTSESNPHSLETTDPSLLNQTSADLSLPRSTPNLLDLLGPTLFRLPPNVHIDNSVTLLPRSKMNTTTPADSSVYSSGPNPQGLHESPTSDPRDKSPRSAGVNFTGSTTNIGFGNAGNSNQSSPQQSSTGQGSPISADLLSNPSDAYSPSFTGVTSRSAPLIGFGGSSNTDASRLLSLVTVSASPQFNEEPSPDGANPDAKKDRTRIPSDSSNGSTPPQSITSISSNRDTAASNLEMASQDPLVPPGSPASAEEPRQLSQSPIAPGSAKSSTQRSTASSPSQPIQIDQPSPVSSPDLLVIPNEPVEANDQPTVPPIQAVSKSSTTANSRSPNAHQEIPNDPDTNDDKVNGQPILTNLTNNPDNLEANPSIAPAIPASPGEPSIAPPESMKPSSPESTKSSNQGDVSPNSMGPLSSFDNSGSTGPMASPGPNGIGGPTGVGGPGDTVPGIGVTGQLGPTGPNDTGTPAGPVAPPLESASPSNPTAPSNPTNSSVSTLDLTSGPKPTDSTQLPNPVSPIVSNESLPNSATGTSLPSNTGTPNSPMQTSSDRPNNDTEDSPISGTASSETVDPNAGDMDEDDVKRARPADPMTKPERLAADIMHSLGCVWIVACSGACFVLGMVTNYRSPDRQLSYSQELSLMLQHLFILLWHDATEHTTLCTAVSISIQYFTLVFYTSMLLDSIRNFLIIVAFLDRANQIPSLAMQAVAWGTPALITSASAIMYYKHYDSDFSCWINADHPVALFTIAPVGLMSALGIIINEASGTLMPCQLVPKGLKDSFHTSFISRHGFFFVLPLSISSWAIGFSAVFYQKLPVYVTVSGINIGLGVAFFFFHALQNDKIRAILERFWKKIKGVFC